MDTTTARLDDSAALVAQHSETLEEVNDVLEQFNEKINGIGKQETEQVCIYNKCMISCFEHKMTPFSSHFLSRRILTEMF